MRNLSRNFPKIWIFAKIIYYKKEGIIKFQMIPKITIIITLKGGIGMERKNFGFLKCLERLNKVFRI